jgi:hypothetical protein
MGIRRCQCRGGIEVELSMAMQTLLMPGWHRGCALYGDADVANAGVA